jgi:transcriptional regulator with XRE-family HTH domain
MARAKQYDSFMLHERIRNLRLSKNLTLQQVADEFQISKASVSSWESGVNKPDSRKLEKLALLLNTTVEFLITGQSRSATEISHSQNSDVPFVMWNKLSEVNLKKFDCNEYVPILYGSSAKRAFATRLVSASSLDWIPGPIPAGAILIVDPDKDPIQNSVVLILQTNGTPLLAQAIETKDGFMFSGLNERQIYKLSSKAKCVGVVIEWRISEKL